MFPVAPMVTEQQQTMPRRRRPILHTDADADTVDPLDAQLMELLRKNNHDFVATLAEINRDDSSSSSNSSRRNSLSISAEGQDPLYPRRLRRQPSVATAVEVFEGPDYGLHEKSTLIQRLRVRLAEIYVDLLDDLSETNEDLKEEEELPKLSGFALRRDMKRCMTESHIYLEMMAGFRNIFIWDSPLTTLMMSFVYAYCVYRGWLLSVILFIFMVQLFANYLETQRKINVGLNLMPRAEVPEPKLDLTGAQMVLEIARYAQVYLGLIADSLEKIKNLFLWGRPKTTATFSAVIVLLFFLSLFVSKGTFFTAIGLGLGVHAFVITGLCHRFPRLKHKLDPAVVLLDHLPTDAQKRRCERIERAINLNDATNHIPSTGDIIETVPSLNEVKTTAGDEKDSKEYFVVVPKDMTEKVADVKVKARSCILVDNEKSFPHTMGAGKLVLTDSALIFTYTRHHKGARKTCLINFDEIKAVHKTHSIKWLSFMPGDGSAIEVTVEGREKPFQFINMSRRDEFFDELIVCTEAAGCSFLVQDEHDGMKSEFFTKHL